MSALTRIQYLASLGLVGRKMAPVTTGVLRVGGTGGTAYMGDWITNPGAANGLSRGGIGSGGINIPYTRLNWDSLTVRILSCPAVQSCLNYIWRNSLQAPPMVEHLVGDNWQQGPHPILDLLNFPTPIHDGTWLDMAMKLSLLVNGNAYAVIERTEGGDAAQLWWVPHSWVEPYTAQSSMNPFAVDYYKLDLGQRRIAVPPENMLHVKFGVDDRDPRLGLSPWASAARDVNTIQQLGNYRPNALRNNGQASKIIWSKDPNVTPDPKLVKQAFDAATQGDNVQSTVLLDFAAEVVFPGISPKDMDTGAFGDVSESYISSLIGLPSQVLGFYVARHHKTDASIKEQRQEAWEGCLMPLDSMINGQIGFKLFPEAMSPTDRQDPRKVRQYLTEWRLTCDYTNVRQLQPDQNAQTASELSVFLAGITTVGEFCQATNRPKPDAAVADMRFSDLQPAASAPQDKLNADGTPVTDTGTAVSGKAWADRILDEIERTKRLAAANGNGRH